MTFFYKYRFRVRDWKWDIREIPNLLWYGRGLDWLNERMRLVRCLNRSNHNRDICRLLWLSRICLCLVTMSKILFLRSGEKEETYSGCRHAWNNGLRCRIWLMEGQRQVHEPDSYGHKLPANFETSGWGILVESVRKTYTRIIKGG